MAAKRKAAGDDWGRSSEEVKPGAVLVAEDGWEYQPILGGMQTRPYACKVKGLNQWEYEAFNFLENTKTEDGGMGRYAHFREMTRILFPKVEWNPWLARAIKALCENEWVAFSGAASSSKTFSSALFAVMWWLACPESSTVIMTSTTKNMLRKRSWSVVQKLFNSIRGPKPGILTDSKTMWQAYKGDDKHAIFGIAVAEGSTTKAMANIQGVHARRITVIVDEATDTPEAILDVAANLYSGCEEFRMLVAGNPDSKFDAMGRFCEPKGGWSTVTVDTDEWETRPQLNGKPALMVRFDAEKSPNMPYGEKPRYPYLVSAAQVELARKKYTENSPQYWKYYRGFWAPEGVVKTVLSENMVLSHHMMAHHTFLGHDLKMVAGFDPAFGGGDIAILQLSRMGQIDAGRMGIEMTEDIEIKLDARSNTPIHYQLVEKTRTECEQRGVTPGRFGLDATGEGGGLADIFEREWGKIHRVEFGAKASDRRASPEDDRPANEVYDRGVTEMWFQVKHYGVAGLLKGLGTKAVRQFCMRRFTDEKRKIVLQTKVEMKTELHQSPDNADAVVINLEVARRCGLDNEGSVDYEKRKQQAWVGFARKQAEAFAENYSKPEEEMWGD